MIGDKKKAGARAKCVSCDYFDPKYSKNKDRGGCRRYPQVVVIGRTDWCGEHKPK